MAMTDAQYDEVIAAVDRAHKRILYYLGPKEDARKYPWGWLICDPDGYRWLPPYAEIHSFSI